MTTTVVKTIGSTGDFSTLALWEAGAPPNLTRSQNATAGTFSGAFIQGEVVTATGITAGTFLDSDTSTYITFGSTNATPLPSGTTITGSTSGNTCVTTADGVVGVIWQGQCQNEEFVTAATAVTVAGSTASSAEYKELTTVSGASFADNANKLTNALRYNAANGAAIKVTNTNASAVVFTEDSARLSRLQIAATGTQGRGLNGGSTNGLFKDIIVEGRYTNTLSLIGVLYMTVATTGNVFSNVIVIQRASAADHIVGTETASPTFYGCTFVAADDLATAPTQIFLSGASGTVTAQNCGLFAGDSTKLISAGSATYNFTTCYSDISGTTGVTQTTFANEFVAVTDAASDYRLKTGAAQIDSGTTDATNEPEDIVGTSRPQGASYDVGVWEGAVTVAGFNPAWAAGSTRFIGGMSNA